MKYPTENYQDVNHYVVDDLDITVAGVGHNSGDVPSEEDVRIATLAAEGWVGEAGASIYTPDTMALCNVAPGAHAITTGNTLHVGFARIRHLDPKAGAVVYAVYEYIAFMCRGKHRVCSASNETIAAELNCSVRSVQYARTRLLELGLLADMDGSDQFSASRVVTIRHFKGSEGAFPLPLQAEISRYVKVLRAKEDSGVRVSRSSPVVTTPDSHVQGASGGCKRLHGGMQAIAGGDASERQRGVQAAAPKGVLGEGELDWENITTVELGDRGAGKGDPATAGRSLAKGNDLDLFKDPYHQPLAPAVETVLPPCPQLAVEVIPLVAAVQLPAKVNKRSVADRGPMKTPIDPSWELNDAGRQYARDLGLSEEQIDDAAFSFVGWHNENSHRREGRFKDWGRRWMDWARKQAGQHRDRGTLGATGKRVLPGRGAQADAGKFKLNAAGEKIAFADEFEVVRLAYGVSVTGDFISEWTAAAEANLGFKLPFGIVMSRCRALRMKYAGKSKDGDTEVNLDYFGKVFIREMQFCDEVLRLRGERTTRSWGEAEWLARMEKKTEPRPDSPPVLIKWDECELGPLPGTELCLMPRHLWKHPATVKLITKTIPFNPNLRGNEKIASTFYDAEIKAAYDAMRESYDKIERDRPMTFARR